MQRHFTLTITASAVAWYAAIVATVAAIIQAANFLRDRVKVKVTFQRNMEIFGDPRRAGMTFTVVRVVNIGRRPVTLSTIGLKYLDPRGAVFTDTVPVLPCELTEGRQVTALVDEAGLKFAQIRSFEAYDAAGRTFRVNYAPWYRRSMAFIRRRFFTTKA